MNIIQKQAFEFYKDSIYVYNFHDYKAFIDKMRDSLYDYHKASYKIEFVDTIINLLKKDYDEHNLICEAPLTCFKNKFHENSLFFLQEEIEELEQQLPRNELTRVQKQEISTALETIIIDINELKTGQQITYDDLMKEFKDLREFLFLDKKNLTQLLLGKITEMTASGMVSETASKSLLASAKALYSSIINS